jgi:hypothetical protein
MNYNKGNNEIYRAVVSAPSPVTSALIAPNTNFEVQKATGEGGGFGRVNNGGVKLSNSFSHMRLHHTNSGGDNVVVTPTTSLPIAIEKFPISPNFAYLRGPYDAAFDAVEKSLKARDCGFELKKSKRDKGAFHCILGEDGKSEFKM